jgi:hypothetical protein
MIKMKVMSISVEPELHEILKIKAESKNQKVSDFVRRLIGYFSLERNDIKPVVLQIPQEALVSRQALESWLNKKSVALVDQFFPESSKQQPSLPFWR